MKKITTNLSTSQNFYLHDWEFLQTATQEVLAGIMAIAGENKVILNGCEAEIDDFEGGSVTSGWIFFDGLIRFLPSKTFAAGTFVSGKDMLVQAKTIAVSPSPQGYPDGVSRDTYVDQQAEAVAAVPGGSGTYQIAGFKRLADVIAGTKYQDWIVPSSLVMLNSATPLTGSDQPFRHRQALADTYEIDGGLQVTGAGATLAYIDVILLPITLAKDKIIVAHAVDSSGNNYDVAAAKLTTTGMLKVLATNAGAKYYFNGVKIPLI